MSLYWITVQFGLITVQLEVVIVQVCICRDCRNGTIYLHIGGISVDVSVSKMDYFAKRLEAFYQHGFHHPAAP